MARGYQLGLGRRVDAVIAGTCDRRRGDAGGLRGVDECAADVVVADQRVLQLEARLLRESERHGIGRVWHREDAVGVRRKMLRRQLTPQGPAHAIDRPAEDRAVGPREVHQLEDAASMWL